MIHRSPQKRDPKTGKEYYAGAAEAADSGEPKLTSTAVRRVRWHGARVLIQKRRRATSRRPKPKNERDSAAAVHAAHARTTIVGKTRIAEDRYGVPGRSSHGANSQRGPEAAAKPRRRAAAGTSTKPGEQQHVLPIGRGTVQGESGWGPQWPTGPPPETNPFRDQGWPERDGDRTSTRGDRRASRRGKRQRRSPSLREGASRPEQVGDHSGPEALPARQTLQVAELTRTATASSHRCQGGAVRPVGGANEPPQGAGNQLLRHKSGSQQGGGTPPRQGAQQADCRGGSTAASVQSPRPGGAVNPGGRTRDDPFRRRQALRGEGRRKHQPRLGAALPGGLHGENTGSKSRRAGLRKRSVGRTRHESAL